MTFFSAKSLSSSSARRGSEARRELESVGCSTCLADLSSGKMVVGMFDFFNPDIVVDDRDGKLNAQVLYATEFGKLL